eukprot:TRINITY_DN33222_c0_g1_i1.p2 TRINITY_DN33222_c0_g1~~TRINITY_DN33222_c0_g1_i1.p2  ORF type:complete len:164 (-),score=41.03 TRINITY_DN33222_c0_g1_i1:54-545(-)
MPKTKEVATELTPLTQGSAEEGKAAHSTMKFALRTKILVKDDVLRKVKRIHRNQLGYTGVVTFLTYAALVVLVLTMQRESEVVSRMDRTIRMGIGGKKGAATQSFQTLSAFWGYIDGTLLPLAFEEPWSTQHGGKTLNGYTTNRYNILAVSYTHLTLPTKRIV